MWAYDLATGALTEGHFDYQFGPVRSLTLADGGAQLIEAGGSAVAFWRLDGGGATARVLVPGDVVPQAYDGDGNLIVTRHQTGPNPDWDLVDGGDGHLLEPFDEVTGVSPIEPGVFAAVFANGYGGWYDSRRHVRLPPTGLGFATSDARSTTESLVVWGEDIQVFDRQRNPAGTPAPVEDEILDLTVSHDGSRIFTIEDTDGGTQVDGGTELVARDSMGWLSGADPLPGVLAAATTSDLVVVGTDDFHLRVLDAETLEPSGRELPGVSSLTQRIRFADDEQRMLVIHADETVQLADLPSRSFLGGPIDPGRLADSDPSVIYPEGSTHYAEDFESDVTAALSGRRRPTGDQHRAGRGGLGPGTRPAGGRRLPARGPGPHSRGVGRPPVGLRPLPPGVCRGGLTGSVIRPPAPLQGNCWWAILVSNQWPLPCEGMRLVSEMPGSGVSPAQGPVRVDRH